MWILKSVANLEFATDMKKKRKNNKNVFQSQNRLQIQDLRLIYKSQPNNVMRKFWSQNQSQILNFAAEKSGTNVNKKNLKFAID